VPSSLIVKLVHLHAYSQFLLLAASVEACRRNIKFNGSVAVSKVESHLADARVYMLENPKKFDVVSRCLRLLCTSIHLFNQCC